MYKRKDIPSMNESEKGPAPVDLRKVDQARLRRLLEAVAKCQNVPGEYVRWCQREAKVLLGWTDGRTSSEVKDGT